MLKIDHIRRKKFLEYMIGNETIKTKSRTKIATVKGEFDICIEFKAVEQRNYINSSIFR